MTNDQTYITLYRRWRPGTFSELIGQEAVSTTLSRAVETGRLAHAYLFCGPRGTGKTSTARILAKAVNCENGPTAEPCGKCISCVEITRGSAIDILEIDAASRRKVEQTRELLETVPYLPAVARRKVYIIDEVHMLTTESFNTLLKNLEEPPEHVLFILATTEIQKVLSTIVSRCQKFDFRPIDKQKILDHLKSVAAKEGIELNDEAAGELAKTARGGMRDALVLLEQIKEYSGGEAITAETVRRILGLSSQESLAETFQKLSEGSWADILDFAQQIYESGADFRSYISDLAQFASDLLKTTLSPTTDHRPPTTSLGPDALLYLANELQEAELRIKDVQQPKLFFELLLLRLSRSLNKNNKNGRMEVVQSAQQKPLVSATGNGNVAEKRQDTPKEPVSPIVQEPIKGRESAKEVPQTAQIMKQSLEKESGILEDSEAMARKLESAIDNWLPGSNEASGITGSDPMPERQAPAVDDKVRSSEKTGNFVTGPVHVLWPAVLEEIRKEKTHIRALLMECQPEIDQSTLILRYKPKFEFHFNAVNKPENIMMLRKVVKSISGKEMQVAFVLGGVTEPVSQAAITTVGSKSEKTLVEPSKALSETAIKTPITTAADAEIKDGLEKEFSEAARDINKDPNIDFEKQGLEKPVAEVEQETEIKQGNEETLLNQDLPNKNKFDEVVAILQDNFEAEIISGEEKI